MSKAKTVVDKTKLTPTPTTVPQSGVEVKVRGSVTHLDEKKKTKSLVEYADRHRFFYVFHFNYKNDSAFSVTTRRSVHFTANVEPVDMKRMLRRISHMMGDLPTNEWFDEYVGLQTFMRELLKLYHVERLGQIDEDFDEECYPKSETEKLKCVLYFLKALYPRFGYTLDPSTACTIQFL